MFLSEHAMTFQEFKAMKNQEAINEDVEYSESELTEQYEQYLKQFAN